MVDVVFTGSLDLQERVAYGRQTAKVKTFHPKATTHETTKASLPQGSCTLVSLLRTAVCTRPPTSSVFRQQ